MCDVGLSSIGTKVAHFRGRKLVGKGVSLPEGYSGLFPGDCVGLVGLKAGADDGFGG